MKCFYSHCNLFVFRKEDQLITGRAGSAITGGERAAETGAQAGHSRHTCTRLQDHTAIYRNGREPIPPITVHMFHSSPPTSCSSLVASCPEESVRVMPFYCGKRSAA